MNINRNSVLFFIFSLGLVGLFAYTHPKENPKTVFLELIVVNLVAVAITNIVLIKPQDDQINPLALDGRPFGGSDYQ